MVWEGYFAKLKQYAAKHGTARVQRDHDVRLYQWCVNQRKLRRKGELQLEKSQTLSSISFSWDLRAEDFGDMFDKLVNFHIENGHCNVLPSTDRKLARWCGEQNYLKNVGRLPDERVRRLHGIGFGFAPSLRRLTIDQNIEVLREWIEEHGHKLVPRKTRLGSFVCHVQR